MATTFSSPMVTVPNELSAGSGPVFPILAKFRAAGKSGPLDWDRSLRQISIAAELPPHIASLLLRSSGTELSLVNESLEVSRAMSQEITQGLIGSYLTPVDCEDLRLIAVHLSKLVRLQCRAASTPNASANAAWKPVQERLAECFSLFAAMIPAVRRSRELRGLSANLTREHRRALETLRAHRHEALRSLDDPSEFVAASLLLAKLNDILAGLRRAQQDVLAISLKYC